MYENENQRSGDGSDYRRRDGWVGAARWDYSDDCAKHQWGHIISGADQPVDLYQQSWPAQADHASLGDDQRRAGASRSHPCGAAGTESATGSCVAQSGPT
jgi:hypothetical protein